MRTVAALLVAALAAAAVPLAAQAPESAYKVPRTPWGDPDLQGNYTNLSEAGTPMERPKEFDGKKLSDIPAAQRLQIKRKLAEQTIGRFLDPLEAPDNWWQPAYGKYASEGAQLWFVVDPANGKIPPLTPDGQKRKDAADAARKVSKREHPDWVTDLTLYDRCITRGLPGSMLPVIYGDAYQIVQAPGSVAIMYEMVHEARVIPLDGRPHASKGVHLDMGDARGHWEGDTLVVETTNFRRRSVYMDANPDRLTLTERFTRVGPRMVRWHVTVDDPTTWTRPWTFAMPLTQDESQPFMPYECHEGNYGVRNILSAARAEDAAAAAKK